MTTFLRWRAGEERRTPRGQFNPLPTDHPMVGFACMECAEPLAAGDVPGLFAVGPDSREDAAKYDNGRWFSALALAAHERCLWPEEST